MRATAIIVGLLMLLDAFVAGGGMVFFSTCAGIVAFPLFLVLAARWARQGQRARAKGHLLRAGLVALLAVESIAVAGMNARVANRGGEQIAGALRRYRHDHGHPPGSLAELVPRYLEKIPPARITGPNRFRYSAWGDGDANLVYYTVMPIRRIYDVRADRWSKLD